MTVDHFTDLFYPGFPIAVLPIAMHLIGRLTAPIMWFFIAEGYHYTKNIRKYMFRLGLFAVISHFAYCFAFGISIIPFKTGIFNQTSVMYPLFIAVVVMWIDDLKAEQQIENRYYFCANLERFSCKLELYSSPCNISD